MRFACIVLDFDGTFTSAEEEGKPFVEAYRRDLARRLAGAGSAPSPHAFDEAWAEAEAAIRARPAEHGWLFDGRIMAPGDADPYIRSSTAARMVMDRFGAFRDPDERERALTELYRASYEHSAIVFRDEARAVLTALLDARIPTHVVTNSDTEAVTRKIAALLSGTVATPPVHGGARKAVLMEPAAPDAAFDALPATQKLDGLERPIYLRRGCYFEVLQAVWRRCGASPGNTLVVGDIYELDLAMPLHLGASVHLVCGPTTPAYERAFVAGHPRATLSDDLCAVLQRVEP